ncbi:hypothetical protein T02_6221 [Trichinella nativa]|uniref:Uncharacterized protein n=1 Tax=Trichinella nativa TaxID=6335 RepID=A0A0V1KKX9_9BILA|nr:hypothetical protein T02_6221 [Trichinella nativa]
MIEYEFLWQNILNSLYSHFETYYLKTEEKKSSSTEESASEVLRMIEIIYVCDQQGINADGAKRPHQLERMQTISNSKNFTDFTS